jgi:hypothetical protein
MKGEGRAERGSPPPLGGEGTRGSDKGDPNHVVTSGDFRFAVRARPFANLTYQLDCLADLIHCARPAVQSMWTPTWTKDDDQALADWKAVRKAYELSAKVHFGDVGPLPVPLPYDELEFDKRVRIAGLLSVTPEDYAEKLRVLLPPQDAVKLEEAAEHFRPRFDAWWRASGAAVAEPFRAGLEGLFEKGELGAIVTRVARFYATPLPHGTTIDFDLVVLPSKSRNTSAEQMVSHGVIEVLPGEKPQDRMDVVCHELFHFLYSSRTPAQQAALANRFGASPDAMGGYAYALLDEAVATALGNGVVDHAVNPADYAERLKTEMGFYGIHAIDATAKGILSRTNEDPTKGPPLDSPETVATLLAATRDAIGEDPRPVDSLRSFGGAAEEGWWAVAMEELTRKAGSNNVYEREPVDAAEAVAMAGTYESLPFVVLVPRARLGALAAYGKAIPKDTRDAIAREAKKPGAFAYAWRKSRQAMGFVIVAEDAKEAKSVAEALFASEKGVRGVFRAKP